MCQIGKVGSSIEAFSTPTSWCPSPPPNMASLNRRCSAGWLRGLIWLIISRECYTCVENSWFHAQSKCCHIDYISPSTILLRRKKEELQFSRAWMSSSLASLIRRSKWQWIIPTVDSKSGVTSLKHQGTQRTHHFLHRIPKSNSGTTGIWICGKLSSVFHTPFSTERIPGRVNWKVCQEN